MEALALADIAAVEGGVGTLRELADLDVEVNGVEALHQLVQEMLGQISTQDAWAGRVAPLTAPHSCGNCGRWQQVQVPFLHHACESCHQLWVPGHCSHCGRTAAMLASEFESSHAPYCPCGHELQRLGLIPRQRATAAEPVPDAPAVETAVRVARRSATGARIAAVAAGMLSIVAAVSIIAGQGSGPAGSTTIVSRPAAAAQGTPAGRGLAARVQITSTGQTPTIFSCTASLNSLTAGPAAAGVPTTAADRSAFITACLH